MRIFSIQDGFRSNRAGACLSAFPDSESPYQPSFSQDDIHPALRMVGESLELSIEVGRKDDAVRKVLFQPLHFGLCFEIQDDACFSFHRIDGSQGYLISTITAEQRFELLVGGEDGAKGIALVIFLVN